MTTNAFVGKKQTPTDEELAATLGPVKPTWDHLLAELAQEFGVSVHEWKCYSPKAGWALRVKRKARTIAWLSPSEGAFNVIFILGAKAMRAARQIKFPQRVIKAMNEAPKYAEGTGVRLEVKSSKDIGTLKKLAAIKLAN
jgi:hypothetical protein